MTKSMFTAMYKLFKMYENTRKGRAKNRNIKKIKFIRIFKI